MSEPFDYPGNISQNSASVRTIPRSQFAKALKLKMKSPINRRSALVVLLLFTGLQATAAEEMAYVSDQLEITMRAGPGTQNKILRMLKSGNALEVVQQDSSGWTQVRTASGKEGWVLKRFLMDAPAARTRLEEVEAREEELLSQQQEIESLRSDAIDGEQRLFAIQEKNTKLEAELKELKQVAADTLSINAKNQKLAASLEQAEARQASLQVENERLRDNTEQAWFVRGAGVILLGMLLGLLIPKLRFKKKRKWGDFSNY